MAKAKMLCPFTKRPCSECAFYRGRHYYLSFSEHQRGYISQPKAGNNRSDNNPIADIDTFDRSVTPWFGKHDRVETEPDIRLKVIDMETEETRICKLEEVRNWDWGNTEMIRTIDGFHISRWERMVEILRYKADNGYKEVVLYEGPRFMLLAGG